MRQYISTLDGLARKMVEDGEAEEKIEGCSAVPVDNWLGRLCRAYEHIWGSLQGEFPFPADEPDLYYENPIIV